MTILELTFVLYLCVGCFLAGQSWEDSDKYYFILRIFIVLFYIIFLPISLILGLVWMCYSPLDSLFQISFYLSFYIFNRKKWRSIDKNVLDNIASICKNKRKIKSLKNRNYIKSAEILFKANNYTSDDN